MRQAQQCTLRSTVNGAVKTYATISGYKNCFTFLGGYMKQLKQSSINGVSFTGNDVLF